MIYNSKTEWIGRIQKGDVLRSRSGRLRVVRGVTHALIPGYGIRTNIVFSIKRCSWTHRCYTIYTGNDLVQMGFRPTRARMALRKRIDRAIENEFHALTPGLSCCDVAGVA